jgi:uncharacterized protein
MSFRNGLAAAIVIAGLAGVACSSGPAPIDTRSYVDQIAAQRAEKDRAFRQDATSPIPAAKRASFQGLGYFPIDPQYRLPASLEAAPSNPPVFFTMETSQHEPRRMQRIGTLRFAIAGAPYTLAAFSETDEGAPNRLFLPFYDQTNGAETYKGGRYLELDRTPTGLYDLDFNRAYHPSCVYDPQYDCPVPPRENRLPVAIRAGERLPQ